MSLQVHDNPAQSRYEALVEDGRLAGHAAYRLAPGLIAFTHTETDPALAGHGMGGRLVGLALEDARRRGLAVLPFCPFVRSIIARDPDRYLDLVRAEDRARFDLPPAG